MNQYLFSWPETLELLRELLVPDAIYESVEDIPFKPLFDRGYQTILLDVDNTLLTFDQRDISLQKINWINALRLTGFQVLLLSNNMRRRRINRICHQVGVHGYYLSMKPMTFTLKKMARRFHLDLSRCIVIGDQLFVDILMGNWVRAYTILVDPINKKQSFFKTMQRELALSLLKKLR